MPYKERKKIVRFVQRLGQCMARYTFGSIASVLISVLYIDSIEASPRARVEPDISSLCDHAAIEASRTSGVPLDVLRAISRAETGRPGGNGLQPWPWTVNMEGTGRWFSTLDEARSYVFLHFKNGARSFDVGCFQINYKWHGEAFHSIDDMFDPLLNAKHAAKFLIGLFQEFGNWPDAAGAYHSRTPDFAQKYTARFVQIRIGLSGETEITQILQADNTRILLPGARDMNKGVGPKPLVPGGTMTLGSLVPIMRRPDADPHPIVVLK